MLRKGFMLHQHLFLQDHSFNVPIFFKESNFSKKMASDDKHFLGDMSILREKGVFYVKKLM